MEMIVATPSPKTIRELMQTPDIVYGQLQLPTGTYRPGSSQIRQGSAKSLSHKLIPVLSPDTATDLSTTHDKMPVEPVISYCCM